MIVLMILGTFVALIGAGVAAVGLGVVARLVFAGIIAVLAGVVLGFVDLHDDDSRPGPEIVAGRAGAAGAALVPRARRCARSGARAPAPAARDRAAGDVRGAAAGADADARQSADEIAARLRQLDQLRDSGLLDEAAYKERRNADPGGALMRFLALLVGLVAALGGSYAAFAAMRAVGPENRTDEFGFGDGATVSPGGGDLFESRNFALVVAALERELGRGRA